MNWYPEQLRVFAHIADQLSALDNSVEELIKNFETGYPGPAPYLENGIKLIDSDGSNLGKFVDEIGGAWSWVPPGQEDVDG